jgi:hypothetical protein
MRNSIATRRRRLAVGVLSLLIIAVLVGSSILATAPAGASPLFAPTISQTVTWENTATALPSSVWPTTTATVPICAGPTATHNPLFPTVVFPTIPPTETCTSLPQTPTVTGTATATLTRTPTMTSTTTPSGQALTITLYFGNAWNQATNTGSISCTERDINGSTNNYTWNAPISQGWHEAYTVDCTGSLTTTTYYTYGSTWHDFNTDFYVTWRQHAYSGVTVYVDVDMTNTVNITPCSYSVFQPFYHGSFPMGDTVYYSYGISSRDAGWASCTGPSTRVTHTVSGHFRVSVQPPMPPTATPTLTPTVTPTATGTATAVPTPCVTPGFPVTIDNPVVWFSPPKFTYGPCVTLVPAMHIPLLPDLGLPDALDVPAFGFCPIYVDIQAQLFGVSAETLLAIFCFIMAAFGVINEFRS